MSIKEKIELLKRTRNDKTYKKLIIDILEDLSGTGSILSKKEVIKKEKPTIDVERVTPEKVLEDSVDVAVEKKKKEVAKKAKV